MSFLIETVAIPVWLLIILIGGMIPLAVKLYKVFRRDKQEEKEREARDSEIIMKLKTLRKSAEPSQPVPDVDREKSKEKKTDILHVLMIMAVEGDKGMLLRAIADRMEISTSKVQQAMQKLIDKELVEEVTGVSGTKYYLTEVGKHYCSKKGFIED